MSECWNVVQGVWETTPKDPLWVLFCHSDCDGIIHPTQASPLADALERVLWNTPAREFYIVRLEMSTFIRGLRMAVLAGEDVEFH